MERSNTVFGLARQYVELRWAGMSQRGRVLTVVAMMLASFGTVSAARMALGGCCASSCAARRAHAAEMAAAAAATGETGTSCSHAH